MAKDYYEILGLSKDANAADIKAAFRKLARELHPDRGGDAQKFKEVNEAYQVLSDTEKRQQYDRYGQTFEQAQSQGGFSGFEGFRDFTGFTQGMGINAEDLGDLFGGMFGGGGARRRSRARRGGDIEADLKVSFRDAVFGVERDIELWKTVQCDRCNGNGGEPGGEQTVCATCSGSGQTRQAQRTFLGNVETVVTCAACHGEGKKWEKLCTTCHGGGVKKARTTVQVKVPAGIADGQTLRLTSQGEAGQYNGRPGDLYFTVRVEEDKEFARRDDDIHSTVALSYTNVALGANIDVSTLDGEVSLKIPAGTQPGQQFRLRGKGVPHLQSSGRGDHLVHVQVATPKSTSRKQRKLLEELSKEGL